MSVKNCCIVSSNLQVTLPEVPAWERQAAKPFLLHVSTCRAADGPCHEQHAQGVSTHLLGLLSSVCSCMILCAYSGTYTRSAALAECTRSGLVSICSRLCSCQLPFPVTLANVTVAALQCIHTAAQPCNRLQMPCCQQCLPFALPSRQRGMPACGSDNPSCRTGPCEGHLGQAGLVAVPVGLQAGCQWLPVSDALQRQRCPAL